VLTPLPGGPAREGSACGGGSRPTGPPRALPIGEVWGRRAHWTEVACRAAARADPRRTSTATLGPELVGSAVPIGPGPRFPLLVKLLDPAAWLSRLVRRFLVSMQKTWNAKPGEVTRRWYVVDAEPGAELLVGLREGATFADAREAIGLPAAQRGTAVVDLLARIRVQRGDAVLLPAGTLHAVGPGVLLYELQQPSDLTYRVDDWGRPATPARQLHVTQALASVGVGGTPEVRRAAPSGRVLGCPRFALDLIDAPARCIRRAAPSTS